MRQILLFGSTFVIGTALASVVAQERMIIQYHELHKIGSATRSGNKSDRKRNRANRWR